MTRGRNGPRVGPTPADPGGATVRRVAGTVDASLPIPVTGSSPPVLSLSSFTCKALDEAVRSVPWLLCTVGHLGWSRRRGPTGQEGWTAMGLHGGRARSAFSETGHGGKGSRLPGPRTRGVPTPETPGGWAYPVSAPGPQGDRTDRVRGRPAPASSGPRRIRPGPRLQGPVADGSPVAVRLGVGSVRRHSGRRVRSG